MITIYLISHLSACAGSHTYRRPLQKRNRIVENVWRRWNGNSSNKRLQKDKSKTDFIVVQFDVPSEDEIIGSV